MSEGIDGFARSSAYISLDGMYRYNLTRNWGDTPYDPCMTFIGLNPSTADAEKDDPTIRRCIGFAKREGFTRLVMLNLFAFRATDPKALITADDPVGPDNNSELMAWMTSPVIVACWGANPTNGRAVAMKAMVRNCGAKLYCFGKTKDGHPKHPLYLPADAPLSLLEPDHA